MSDTKPQTLRTDTQTRGAPTGFPSDRPRKHTRPRGANGPRICGFFFGTSYDSSILGLGYSRFMIHESGSMFGFARVGWCINSVINVNIKDGTLQIRKKHGKP